MARSIRRVRRTAADRGSPLRGRRGSRPGETSEIERLAPGDPALSELEVERQLEHDHDSDPVEAAFEVGLPKGSVIRQGDRLKAYRPISAERRREALEAGLEAYDRGDFFEAHELLEPAWMGTNDIAEREMYQALIKLAAGYVHCVRGNPIGMSRNLEGCRLHLEEAVRLEPSIGREAGVDLLNLIMEVEVRLKSVQVAVAHLNTNPTIMLELAEAAPKIR